MPDPSTLLGCALGLSGAAASLAAAAAGPNPVLGLRGPLAFSKRAWLRAHLLLAALLALDGATAVLIGRLLGLEAEAAVTPVLALLSITAAKAAGTRLAELEQLVSPCPGCGAPMPLPRLHGPWATLAAGLAAAALTVDAYAAAVLLAYGLRGAAVALLATTVAPVAVALYLGLRAPEAAAAPGVDVAGLAAALLGASLAAPLLSGALGLLVLRRYYAAAVLVAAGVAAIAASRRLGRRLLPGRRRGAGGC